MSRYSSNSDDESYRSKKARRKRQRSESYSSNDSYRKRRDDRRNRRSRSRSRDRSSRQSSKSSYKRDTGKVRSLRSRSPSFRSRRQRSYSRSRSRSPSYNRSKYSKPKRRYKSRSRSHSYSRRRSRSDSRLRRKKRSRSRSTSTKKSVHRSSSSSDSSNPIKIAETKQKEEKPDDFSIKPISMPSDDPILKQQLLDDINDPSFAPKTFKSSRNDSSNFSNSITTNDHIKLENPVVSSDNTVKPGNKKNETVFHDSIAFEDSEAKIQKWVKKLYTIRQRFLLEHPTPDDDSFDYF